MPSDAPPIARSPVAIRQVPPDRPWLWLTAGWRDLMASSQLGFFYGGALTLAGWLLALALIWARSAWAILPASAGFFLVAPLLAAGLYEASRLREAGQPVTFAACLGGFTRNGGQLAFLGIVLLLLHLFWIRIAALIFMLMFGVNFAPALEDLPMAMLRSPMLLPFLIVGTAAGAALAAVAFAISAVSIPMLVDRAEMTAMEAIITSVRSVVANPGTMLFWAGLIVVFTAMAMVPFFLGLALVIPLIGHATWHAYRDLVG
ncbi:DUF2189 domain-containing protein [Roseomonas terrae]|uniref:DUF2189 domain-containing protein n=1 Tax=Neoroseomonas terrae TaxID=424799 RepID=A0ABS5EMT6_9PROT|nr:DUF2189 domain-containing protein [Neoroseomonas terrae]MBR0652336.1 DUF2189 domain-containing protein [Neoroseomonas terrae]